MGLIFWWIFFVWAFAIGIYILIRYVIIKPKRGPDHDKVPIAHSSRLRHLPEYKAALERYERIITACFVTLSVAIVFSMIVTARPASVALITPAKKGRDIMLCLDVSGSLLRVDTTIVNRYKALVRSFSGQRFGLTVFNSSSVSIIPLNDDKEFTIKQLDRVGKALSVQKGQAFTDITSGTLANFEKGTSLVSDGVTSCISNLGANPLKRSQSIILATDNDVHGKPIIKMKQAIGLAKDRDIRAYILDPDGGSTTASTGHTELLDFATKTGGKYNSLDDKSSISEIIDDISKQEEQYASSAPTVAVSDQASIFLYVAVITTVASLILFWRLRL